MSGFDLDCLSQLIHFHAHNPDESNHLSIRRAELIETILIEQTQKIDIDDIDNEADHDDVDYLLGIVFELDKLPFSDRARAYFNAFDALMTAKQNQRARRRRAPKRQHRKHLLLKSTITAFL